IREEFRTSSGQLDSGRNPPPVTIHTWLERFNKQKPRSFEKVTTPVDAKNWISHMEKIFDVMGCEDAFKTRLAVYKFEGNALAWWKAYKQAKGGDVWLITLTWAKFKKLFFLQFFPRAEQEHLKREYHSIRQTDTETSTQFMQHFLRLAGFLGAAAGTEDEQAKNFQWGLRRSTLNHLMCIQFTDVAQVANAARNYEILHERDDDDAERPDKRQKNGDRHQPTTQQSSHRNHGHNNDRHGSDRRGGGDNHRSSNNNYSGNNNKLNFKSIRSASTHKHDPNITRYSYPVCTTCGRRHPGECRRAARTCFKCGQTGYLQKDCKKNTAASTSGQADKKPGASGRVFAITEDHATKTSDELPGIPSVRKVEFNIEFIPGAEPISMAPYRMASIELKELKDQLQELLERSYDYTVLHQRSCQQVKIEHQRASGLLQPLDIPVWKWDEISMDFVTGLPRTQRRHDAIWVVVDRLTKSAHFLPIRKDYSVSKLAETFQQEIEAWGTRLKFSTAFYPQTDGQTERTIQTLEDMLCSYALEWIGNWDDYICLVEFAYNNSWHASIMFAPFKMLYGRKCRALICWDQVGERVIEGPEMIEVTNEKVVVAKEKLKEARTRQKSYADKHRRSIEFHLGDRVFFKVSPASGIRRFGIKGKLSPRFIRPFEILDRVGEVLYRLALPPQLSYVHNVFHVSLLRGYKHHPLHVISYPLDQIRADLSYVEETEAILDRQNRVMRNKTIPFVKIL
nr:putative nucleotidyltransferase, ribonuclease H [Tanacetum cinerariifolium]